MENDKQKYIVRCDDGAIFYGEIAERNGQEVTLRNVRNIYWWEGAATISQLALEGTKRPHDCQFTVVLSEIIVLNVLEIIPCTEAAVNSLDAVKEWKM